ncbi:MAG TPA: porin family protein, partial [Bacteroidales bacterium]|nr:porin family protein [Bacteroidales bacterium]
MSIFRKRRLHIASIVVIGLIVSGNIKSQDLQFSLYADPLIGWFSSDTKGSSNEGARPGFSLGLIFDKYFADNYALSTGISMMNVSGRVFYSDTTTIRFKNSTTELNPEENITYRIQFLSIPVGLKLRTNQIGYMTLFTNVGLDPKIVIGGKADIPSQEIK